MKRENHKKVMVALIVVALGLLSCPGTGGAQAACKSWKNRAQGIANRNLTLEERQQYLGEQP